jgi:hypothetical protein
MNDWVQQYRDAWDSHDGAKVASFMAAYGTYEDVALGVTSEGRDAIKAFVDEGDLFSKDFTITPVSAHVTGDQCALEWEMAGTNTGATAGFPATNKPYRVRVCRSASSMPTARSSRTVTTGIWLPYSPS